MRAGGVPGSSRGAQKAFGMSHASDVSAARRHSQMMAEQAGLAATEAGRLAIIVTEAGTNILKHGADGWLVVTMVWHDGRAGVEIVAMDRGPGILNVDQSLRDGVSTVGTAGTGLGAMRRLSDGFDFYSAPGLGTALYMVVYAAAVAPADRYPDAMTGQPQRLSIGTMCLPIASEDLCGDGWGIDEHAGGATVLVVDGLGHGPGAAAAAQAAIATLCDTGSRPADLLMQAMHEALRQTRGAAAAVATLDYQEDRITFVGIGNIAACVIEGDERRQLVSHNGIVGHNMRKLQAFSTPWTVGSTCVFCSDGIGTQWDLNRYPGLLQCHPSLIASVLYRDFMRVRDDATVVIVKRLV